MPEEWRTRIVNAKKRYEERIKKRDLAAKDLQNRIKKFNVETLRPALNEVKSNLYTLECTTTVQDRVNYFSRLYLDVLAAIVDFTVDAQSEDLLVTLVTASSDAPELLGERNLGEFEAVTKTQILDVIAVFVEQRYDSLV